MTGLLAILGFSLYDTVVVFDKVKENTTKLRKSTQTYADAANLAVNQTLVRSINTSIVALIPIGAILYVSAVQLGASSLQDLALAQFVGMAAGVYSSVCSRRRVLVHLKSGETEVVEQARRAKARAGAGRPLRRGAGRQGATCRSATTPGAEDDRPARPARAADADDEPGNASSASDEALGKGRVAPTADAPGAARAAAAGRQQPTRQPRSKRGKK